MSSIVVKNNSFLFINNSEILGSKYFNVVGIISINSNVEIKNSNI